MYAMKNLLKAILFLAVLLPCMPVWGQPADGNWLDEVIRKDKKRYPYSSGRYSPGKSVAGACMLDRPRVIDSSRLEISYTAEIVLDTLVGKKTSDIVITQVGDSVRKYYSWVCWRYNMNHTLFETNREGEQVGVNSAYQVAVDYAVYRMGHSKMLNRHLLPRVQKLVYEYEEPLPRFEWTMSGDTLTVAGYACYKATSDYAGRHWTVWFTPQVPVDGGLWKFNGLPGLILEAYDSQDHFHFRLRAIKQEVSPILYYETPSKRVPRREYRDIERKRYKHPFSSDREFMAVKNPNTGKMEYIPDDWEVPYNPIERE